MDMARKLVNKLKQKQQQPHHHRRSISDVGPSTQFNIEHSLDLPRKSADGTDNNEMSDHKAKGDRVATPPLSWSSGDLSGDEVMDQGAQDRPITRSSLNARENQPINHYTRVDWRTAAEAAEYESGIRDSDSDFEDNFLVSPVRFTLPWSNADRPGRRPRRPPTKSTIFNNERWERKKHFRQLNEVTPVVVERELFRRLGRYESD